jgi:hypothetical protein
LTLEAELRDHASIWCFRQTIEKLGLSAALLSETNRQLDALGPIVMCGTLVDATLIAASVKHAAYGAAERAVLKIGYRPIWNLVCSETPAAWWRLRPVHGASNRRTAALALRGPAGDLMRFLLGCSGTLVLRKPARD